MSKDPAFLFYSSDFLTGTMFMSHEQVGKYIRLLCAQHQKGRLLEKDMINICNSYDEDIFSKFQKEDNLFFNKRLEEESEKRAKYSESRRNNRLKKDMTNICNSYDKHMENENEDVNINVIKDKKKDAKIEKSKFGTYENIFLHESEFEKIKKEFGEDKTIQAINHLSAWGKEKPQKFKEYKDHNLTIRRWVFDAISKPEKESKPDYKHPTSIQQMILDRQNQNK